MATATTEAPAAGDFFSGETWAGKIFSAGWIDAPVTIDITEPATGETLGTAGAGDPASVAAAAAAAAKAQPEWAATTFLERGAVLRRAASFLERELPAITEWMVRETGSLRSKSEFEVMRAIDQVHQAAALVVQPMGHTVPSWTPGRTSVARRVPVGVAGVITPWNFPLVLGMRSVAPALAVGNAVVLKSDPNSPVSGGVVIARAFEEAGLPPGVLHVLSGGAEVGEAIVTDPNVSMVSFTGSSRVGKRVGELAGARLKPAVLELGGNSPLIVLRDADIEAASSAAAWGAFLHAGQICMAVSRVLVDETIAEEYVSALAERAGRLRAGNPATEEVALGPIINEKQMQRVERIVGDSVAQGASVHAGGNRNGPFYPPTVLADVTPSMPVYAEEIFGPVAPVTTFTEEDEAIELANGTGYGLAAAVQSRSHERAARVAERLRAGMVHVNDQTVNEESPAPFGGFGISGNGGHFGGVANLEVFTKWQWLTSREQAAPFPF